ncbi:uncharacterized protein [Diadema antillarum]|uniref:uncharacterized protein n=1 Tax=Diadema antillarum TaxID=105358 RepID=UPI003A8666CB
MVNLAQREAEPSQPRQKRAKTDKSFSCDHCKSRFVVNPLRRKPGQKSKGVATPRYKIDPKTQKRLTLCNTCGLQFDRKAKPRPRDPPPTEEDKQGYYKRAELFAASLVEGLGEPDAEKLTCPVYNTKPCGCIQKFIVGEGDGEQSKKRALRLLSILKNAKQLREKKFYNREEVLSKGKGQRKVGLGNGHRKSKEYEDFVLSTRKVLRGDLRMCERATQRILHYSNNFLHKRLKTDPLNRTQRLERTKGQAALGKLMDIDTLPEQTCCEEKCVLMAKTHGLLLKQWRERAISGQAEARKVLAEMLTPSGQSSNCPKFIAMVTGSSFTTIARVKEQMWKTGGDREPPQHGLRTYWKNHPRRKTCLLGDGEETVGPGGVAGEGGGGGQGQASLMTVAQLREQQDQLKRQQQQLEEQQQQVRQQLRVVEQQLVQHQLRRTHIRQQTALVEAQKKVIQQRSQGKTKPAVTAATTSSTGPHLHTQTMTVPRGGNHATITLQPTTVYQQGSIQSVTPTSQQSRPVVTQTQPIIHPLPAVVGVNMEPAVQSQQVHQEQPQQQQQQQQQLPQLQPQQLTTTSAGLEAVDPKMLQHNLQLLVEIQNQMVAQQLQQHLISGGVQGSGTANQPPSYSTAVAATNQTQGIPAQQQPKQVKETQQQAQQVIIQAIPGMQPGTLVLNGSGTAANVSRSSGNSQPFIGSQTNVSLQPSKGSDTPQFIFPITVHSAVNQSINEELVNVEEVNVQLQEVVMPLTTQVSVADEVPLPRQQLGPILQSQVQPQPITLNQLASHANPAQEPRPTATATISIESLCGSQQSSPSNIGELVVAETQEAAASMLRGDEENISASMPLVGGVSFETLLSPEALLLATSGQHPSMSVSLSATRTTPSSSGASGSTR